MTPPDTPMQGAASGADAGAPSTAMLNDALEATWAPARHWRLGPFVLRDGAGGGQRVSAATADAAASAADVTAAEDAQRAAGQTPLFRLRPDACPWDAELDAHLAGLGYALGDPTLFFTAPTAALAGAALPRLRAFAIWPPLAIQRELWAAAGIGPARLAVMARAVRPATALMGREGDRVAGTAFVACAGPLAMLHALEVHSRFRRRGMAQSLTRAAAHWALSQGADSFALAVTAANAPACALYAGMGMVPAGAYHYRIAPEA